MTLIYTNSVVISAQDFDYSIKMSENGDWEGEYGSWHYLPGLDFAWTLNIMLNLTGS